MLDGINVSATAAPQQTKLAVSSYPHAPSASLQNNPSGYSVVGGQCIQG
jgi:hypothetical protein